MMKSKRTIGRNAISLFSSQTFSLFAIVFTVFAGLNIPSSSAQEQGTERDQVQTVRIRGTGLEMEAQLHGTLNCENGELNAPVVSVTLEQIRCVSQGTRSLRMLRLCHDSKPYDKGRQQTISLLRLHFRAETRLAYLSVKVDSRQANRGFRHRADQEDWLRAGTDPGRSHKCRGQDEGAAQATRRRTVGPWSRHCTLE